MFSLSCFVVAPPYYINKVARCGSFAFVLCDFGFDNTTFSSGRHCVLATFGCKATYYFLIGIYFEEIFRAERGL